MSSVSPERGLAVIHAYYLLVFLALTLVGPFLLIQKKARAGLSQKLGIIPADIIERSGALHGGIWIHAVSVGEFNAVWPLLQRLKEKRPDLPIMVSTTTKTGQNLARERAGSFAEIFYFPFDLPFFTRKWIETLRPSLVAIAETEIWPGFLLECRKRDIPVVAINGRISPGSFKTYLALRSLFAGVVNNYAALAVQTESEAERYAALAGREPSQIPVTITGNLKLDGLKACPGSEIEALRTDLAIAPEDFVIVAGSTHEGEEAAVLRAFEQLRAKQNRSLRLIIAPRHPERFSRAKELIESSGFRARLHSRQESFEKEQDVYLLDGLGQLAKFYGLASVAFVGGTLADVGGHNIAEPYAYSVPVVCGPNLYKTRDAARALQAISALTIARDEEELAREIDRLYKDPTSLQDLGERGNRWIAENQGAVDRTLAVLLPLISAPAGDTSNPGAVFSTTGATNRREQAT